MPSELRTGPCRIAHVDEPGLHPALEPAGALGQPVAQSLRRILPRWRVDHAAPVAVARQAHGEVGILGDVVRVPAPDLLQRRATEMRPYVAKAPRVPSY